MKHIIVGLVATLLGVWGVITWWVTFAAVMRGVIPFALLIFGLVAILSGSRRFFATEEHGVEAPSKTEEAMAAKKTTREKRAAV